MGWDIKKNLYCYVADMTMCQNQLKKNTIIFYCKNEQMFGVLTHLSFHGVFICLFFLSLTYKTEFESNSNKKIYVNNLQLQSNIADFQLYQQFRDMVILSFYS